MLSMAKRKKGRARERGDTVTFTFEMTPAHADALEACRVRERRTKTTVLLLALEEYLQRAGLWPPQQPQGEAAGPG
jgi:hypothetical protein